MVHHKKTFVAIKQHKGEVAGAVIVDDTSVFVGEGAKTIYNGNGFIINIIDEGGPGFVIVIFVGVIRNEAQHEGMIVAWGTRKGWTCWFWSCAP